MTEKQRNQYIRQMYNAAETLYETEMPVLTEEKFALFETVGNRLEYEHDYFERRKFLTVFGCTVMLGSNGNAESADCSRREERACIAVDAASEKSAISGEKTRKYPDKLEHIIASICSEECWALPAHVNRKADPDWRITVDLFASETAQALAELYAGLKGVLPETLRDRMKAEIMRRVIGPFAAKQPYTWWEHSDMNWNAVCNGSIGMAALDLLDDEPELQEKLVRRVHENLGFFLDGFAEDGACLEGIGYFTYGFYYYMGFMDLLARKAKKNEALKSLVPAASEGSGSKDYGADLILNSILPKKCRKIAEFQQKCYFPSGLSLSFSDGSKHEKYRIGLTCRLAGLFDTVEIPDISCAAGFDADPCYRFLMASRDLSWSGEYCSRIGSDSNADSPTEFINKCSEEKTDPNAHSTEEKCTAETRQRPYRKYDLPSAQWSICHGASGGGFAIKGGHNAEPHNHNDIGSFIYALGDHPLLTDLGAGEYTAQYFRDETRYDYICCSSLGHNVPVINGCGQKAGREYACESFTCSIKNNDVCGHDIGNADNTENTDKAYAGGYGEADGRTGYETALSYAGAYDVPELCGLIRNTQYEPETEVLEIEDIFESDGCMIEENLVTQGAVEFVNGAVYIKTHNTENGNKTGDSRKQENSNREDSILEDMDHAANYTCRITSGNGFPEMKITEEPFMNHEGKPETVKRITWKVADATQTGTITCRIRIEPVR